jgi:hypothetical protein
MEAFERYGADAVTVNAYLGPESVEPFLDYHDRGVIVLCRTSNPDSGWLQSYPADQPVFLRIAAHPELEPPRQPDAGGRGDLCRRPAPDSRRGGGCSRCWCPASVLRGAIWRP